ncbi:hypothetical protein GUJ93_ZPchr0010g7831 [Zizania palustris]|uniref:Uncharacterized protein n=1 Tax=Zizania palustris TaxID=103762 RepID=A0A8J5WAV6_ZIZPA|nr:hypothetical protein GUJ93_ZPchr0010g7831 [Zizania palustris]
MRELAWRPGTWGGLALRVGQVTFAAASIGVMASGLGFANYTAFWYPRAPLGFGAASSCGALVCAGGSCRRAAELVDPCSVVSLPPGTMQLDAWQLRWGILVGRNEGHIILC